MFSTSLDTSQYLQLAVSVDITFPVSSVEDQDGSSYGESMRQPDDSDDEVDAGNNTIHRPSTPAVSSRSLRSAGMSNGVDTSNGDPPRSQTRVPIAVTISAAPPRKATHDQGVQTSVGASAGGELYGPYYHIPHIELSTLTFRSSRKPDRAQILRLGRYFPGKPRVLPHSRHR